MSLPGRSRAEIGTSAKSRVRYLQYLSERFPLTQFTALAGFLAVGAGTCLQARAYGGIRDLHSMLLAFLGLLFFLFRLRLFDELKDYAHDLVYYPERPLPRGLMTTRDIALLIGFSLAVETLVAAFAGVVPLIYFSASCAYSLLMFREFFLRGWLRTRFTAYVLSHELLVIPLFFYIAALQGFAADLYRDPIVWTVTLFSGCQLFSLEVSRKMRPAEQENAARDTYTSQYGIRGASVLLAATGTAAVALGFLATGGRNPVYAAALAPLAHLLHSIRCFVRRPDGRAAKAVFGASVLHFCLLSGVVIWVALT